MKIRIVILFGGTYKFGVLDELRKVRIAYEKLRIISFSRDGLSLTKIKVMIS
jgi:hypothetical protein